MSCAGFAFGGGGGGAGVLCVVLFCTVAYLVLFERAITRQWYSKF